MVVRRNGNALVSVVVSMGIAATTLSYFLMSMPGNDGALADLTLKVRAEAMSSELLEFFRSLSTAQLRTYMSTNPANGSTAPNQLYPLCAHVGILNRASNQLVNRDPNAELPPTANPLSLLNSACPPAFNRFYQVQVVDIMSLSVNAAACNQNPAAYALGANERYLVTVGVTWNACAGSGGAAPQRIVMSTVVP